jgi:hypothetical protein
MSPGKISDFDMESINTRARENLVKAIATSAAQTVSLSGIPGQGGSPESAQTTACEELIMFSVLAVDQSSVL